MNFLSFIEFKRDGHALTPEQIQFLVTDYVNGKIPDYQIAAFLMAIFFRGMTAEERTALTLAMRDSGDVLKFPKDARPIVDKHSTGGVGDKVSLPLAPLLACLGFRVPMISGRGLGITGGTLDKLESIPGFRTALTINEIVAQVQKIGCVICAQTEKMVPADRKLYALRDVTGTVPSIPLITASILSKKLAENLDALILDVKFGSAAFMQTKNQARELAQAMVSLGRQCGVKTTAMLTQMNTPLGRAAGNWLEIRETVDFFESFNASNSEREKIQNNLADLTEIVVECAAHLLVETCRFEKLADARKETLACLASGEPQKKWNEMLVTQGADLDAFQKKLKKNSECYVLEFKADRAGFVQRSDARIIGEIVRDLGGGRLTKETQINHAVGMDQIAKPGESVQENSVLARVHASSEKDAKIAFEKLKTAFEISKNPPENEPLIAEIVSGKS
jgi:pyrimidine-nucleoside phosphorylase